MTPYQDPAGAIFFCDLAEGDLRMSYLKAEGEFSFLREFLRLSLPNTVTELHTPKVFTTQTVKVIYP